MKVSRLNVSRHRALFAVCAIAVLGLIGCGSDSEDSTQAENSTQPKAAYIKQADAICAKTEVRQNALVADVVKEPPIKDERKAFTRTVEKAGIPPLQQQVEELEDLATPDPGAAEAEAFMTAFEKALREVEADPPSIAEAPNPFEEAEKLAKDFGFKVCGGS